MKNSLRIRQFLAGDRGTGLVEYSLLMAFVVFILIGLAHGFHSAAAGVTCVTSSNLGAASSVLH